MYFFVLQIQHNPCTLIVFLQKWKLKLRIITFHCPFDQKLKRRNLTTTYSLRKKCPYSELFRSVFSTIQTEYGEIRSIQSECGKIRIRVTPNTDTFQTVISFHFFIEATRPQRANFFTAFTFNDLANGQWWLISYQNVIVKYMQVKVNSSFRFVLSLKAG